MIVIIIIIIITDQLNLHTAITVIDNCIIFCIISPFKYGLVMLMLFNQLIQQECIKRIKGDTTNFD